MVSNIHMILLALLGIIVLIIFFDSLRSYSQKKKDTTSNKTHSTQDISYIDIKVWLQERGFWIPRLILVLTSNSILFLAYVRVRLLQFGGIIAIFATIGNILYSIYLASFARKHDSLQKRIAPRIPIEYRHRTPTGRWGFVPLMVILELIWIVSLLHSFFGWFK